MSTPRKTRRVYGGAAGSALLLLLTAVPADAQRVIPNFARSDQSDVTGVSVTSGDQFSFEPGSTVSFTCPVAWGVRTTSEQLQSDLSGGVFRVPGTVEGGVAVPAEVQGDLLALLTDAEGSSQAADRIVLALAREDNPGTRGKARALVRHLEGLVTVSNRMDPERPGYLAPRRLGASVGAFNSFVDASSDEFLRAPAVEMQAVQAVLSRLVIAAAENEGRVVTPAAGDAADGGGLACAPPAPPVTAPPTPPELAISRCVMVAEGPVEVVAAVNPATGDTMAIVQGQRIPFRTAYPETENMASRAPWFVQDEPLTYGRDQYVKFGLSRAVAPGFLRRIDQYRGVPIFAESDAGARPDVIYVPVGPACEFHPYRRHEEIQRVRG